MTDQHAYIEARPGTYQSQNGEDVWIEKYFNGKLNGVYVDVGAYDGKVISNTYHFEQIGWTGILVEPNSIKADLCRKNRPRSIVFECAAVADPNKAEITFYTVEGASVYSTSKLTPEHEQRVTKQYGLGFQPVTVKARTLDSMIEEAGLASVDFVSIDVEEGELDVLNGFNIGRWKPQLVVIEENRLPRRTVIRDYFVSHGYGFYAAIECNHVYVPRGMVADRLRYLKYQLGNVRRRWCG